MLLRRRSWTRLGLALMLGIAGGRLGWCAQESPAIYAGDIHDRDEGVADGGGAMLLVVGTRNGAFSGRAVIGAGQPVKATLSDLSQGAAVIPASACEVRFGAPYIGLRGPSQIRPVGNDLLLDAAPSSPGKKPIWVTIRVPKTAKAGEYSGRLHVELQGAAPADLPVKLQVQDWTLPDPQEYRTWVELVQSPDTLAVEYNVPLWSEKHWALIGRSLDLIAATGSRVIYIPLIARTNYGNAESMVRWIKKGESKYEYDFANLDKYLELVEKHLGAPKISQIYAWESYLQSTKATAPVEIKNEEGSYEYTRDTASNALIAMQGKGPSVTVLDPATGKTDTIHIPRYEDPASKALWKPVWDGVRERLAKRGWQKSMMVGNVSDLWPNQDEVKALNELSGGLPWTDCSHHLNTVVNEKTLGKLQGLVDWGYAALALDWQSNINPAKTGNHYGWKQPSLAAQYWRFQFFNAVPHYNTNVHVRHAAETQITANRRGIGHLGADFWPCLKNKRGEYISSVTDRFPESYWRSLHIMSWMLGPGPSGPVGTGRLEIFREGIQECEARIAIESALSDEALKAKLGPELSKRAQDYLNQRLQEIWRAWGLSEADVAQLGYIDRYREWYETLGKRVDCDAGMKWFLGSHWQERSAKIFALAGEVQRKLGGH